MNSTCSTLRNAAAVLVPTRLRLSLNIHNNGVDGSASILWFFHLHLFQKISIF
ncbi:MAG: hypothetical protein CM15mP4_1290 [Candidatus Neomarinimicrobiota bacterium]|nr:MAG: hypothetical protein CM15mP4_1290 [Candidatus Neomarinimicrobiota bacterium]